jgi:hypothetical protein
MKPLISWLNISILLAAFTGAFCHYVFEFGYGRALVLGLTTGVVLTIVRILKEKRAAADRAMSTE